MDRHFAGRNDRRDAVAASGVLAVVRRPTPPRRGVHPRKNCDINLKNVKPIAHLRAPSTTTVTDVLVMGSASADHGGLARSQGARIVVFEKLTRDKWDEHCGVQVLGGLGGEEWGKITKRGWNPAKDVDAAAYEIWAAQDYQADYRLIRKQVEEWPTPIEMLRSIGCKFFPVDLGDSFVGRMKINYPAIRYTNVGNELQDFTPMDPWINKYHVCEVAIERFLKNSGKAELIYGADNTRLITNAAGRVVGAATVKGNDVFVKAKSPSSHRRLRRQLRHGQIRLIDVTAGATCASRTTVTASAWDRAWAQT